MPYQFEQRFASNKVHEIEDEQKGHAAEEDPAPREENPVDGAQDQQEKKVNVQL